MRLAEYSDPFISGVWKFFDGLRPAPEYFKAPDALPEPETGIAADCRGYIGRLMADGLSSVERDKIELDFVTAMREKYPRLKWMCGRSANSGR